MNKIKTFSETITTGDFSEAFPGGKGMPPADRPQNLGPKEDGIAVGEIKHGKEFVEFYDKVTKLATRLEIPEYQVIQVVNKQFKGLEMSAEDNRIMKEFGDLGKVPMVALRALIKREWSEDESNPISKEQRKEIWKKIGEIAKGKKPGEYPVFSGDQKVGTLLVTDNGKFGYNGKFLPNLSIKKEYVSNEVVEDSI